MKNILIVDDENDIRELYQSELESEGYSAYSVASGEKAIQYLENAGSVDLIVLDIKLGGMGGLKVLEKLRNERSEIPVILNSAYSTYKNDFNSWLADAYLVKSSNLNELKSQIKELLPQ